MANKSSPLTLGLDGLNQMSKAGFQKSQMLAFRNTERQISDPRSRKPTSEIRPTPLATIVTGKSWDGQGPNPYDGKVLRFYAYLTEAVANCPDESERVRRMCLLYYLEDDSLHIDELKQENSGIPQGVFLKRHRVPRDTSRLPAPGAAPGKAASEGSTTLSLEDLVTFQEFNIGSDITLYGRTFHIVDADAATKKFMQEIGTELGEARPFPDDDYSRKRAALKDSMRPTHTKEGPSDTLRQFLDNDGKVLRWYAMWDDRSQSAFGDRRFFRVHYYLSDNKVEVVERITSNAGRDPFPVFMKKGVLPKQGVAVGGPGTAQPPVKDVYQPEDFHLGGTIFVYNRPFLLYDADAFTRGWYTNKFGTQDWPEVDLALDDEEEFAGAVQAGALGLAKIHLNDVPNEGNVSAPAGGQENMSPAPTSGVFGGASPFDASGGLPPVRKRADAAGVSMRFSAKLVSNRPIDAERRFVVTIWPEDDMIGVYEPPVRNSGIMGGQFLRRTRVLNPATGVSYKASDMFAGATVNIMSHIFKMVEADESALCWMEDHKSEFPLADPNAVVASLSSSVEERAEEIRAAFMGADVDGSGCLSKGEFRAALEGCGLAQGLVEQQIIALHRGFDKNKDGSVCYAEFLDVLLPC